MANVRHTKSVNFDHWSAPISNILSAHVCAGKVAHSISQMLILYIATPPPLLRMQFYCLNICNGACT